MTPNEIKEKVERYLNRDNVDLNSITDGIEEAMNWLGNMGYLINTINMVVEAEEFYELPEDLISILKIEDPEKKEIVTDYIVDGNLIRFKEQGEYRVFAERQPLTPLDESTELELHIMLQYCVLDYVKGFCKVSIDDTSQDGHRLMQKFQQDSLKAYQAIKRGRNSPTNWKVIRRA